MNRWTTSALALPDEIATLLTKSQGLAVRPFGYVDGEQSTRQRP